MNPAAVRPVANGAAFYADDQEIFQRATHIQSGERTSAADRIERDSKDKQAISAKQAWTEPEPVFVLDEQHHELERDAPNVAGLEGVDNADVLKLGVFELAQPGMFDDGGSFEYVPPLKQLRWSDEQGYALAEIHYCDTLHYGDDNYQNGDEHHSGSCCSLM